MPPRRILRVLGESRVALHDHADALALVAGSLARVAPRLRALGERSAKEMLVGFVSEQRALAVELEEAARGYERQAGQLAMLASERQALALRLEREAGEVRNAFFRLVGNEGAQLDVDAMFLAHLKSKRRLRRSVSDVLEPASREVLAQRTAEADALVPTPHPCRNHQRRARGPRSGRRTRAPAR